MLLREVVIDFQNSIVAAVAVVEVGKELSGGAGVVRQVGGEFDAERATTGAAFGERIRDAGAGIADGHGDGSGDFDGIADLVANTLVIAEDEKLVFEDGAAGRGAELMQVDGGHGSRRGIEPVARVDGVVAVEVVGGTVKGIGAGLDADVDDGAGLPTVVGLGAGLNVEFLNGVDGENCGGRSLHTFRVDDGGAIVGVVVVDAVDDKVIFLGTVAVGGDGEETAAGLALNAGLKDGEILKITALERKFVDGLVGESLTEYVAGGVDNRGFAAHHHDFGACARLELNIDAGVFGDFQANTGVIDGGKTLGLNLHGVRARLESRGDELAGVGRCDGSRNAACRVGNGNGSAGDEGAGYIGHGAENPSLRSLRRELGYDGQDQDEDECQQANDFHGGLLAFLQNRISSQGQDFVLRGNAEGRIRGRLRVCRHRRGRELLEWNRTSNRDRISFS